MEIVINRAAPVADEARQLPATTYNLAHRLLVRSRGVVFVPIRAMQFLAVIDREEVVFVDCMYKDQAVIAWQGFRPRARTALDQPVPYQAVYYREGGPDLMLRLQTEFAKALAGLSSKDVQAGPATVLKFPTPEREP